MNDEEMIGAVRGVSEALGGVRMDRSVEQISRRARSRRLRQGLSAAGAGCLTLGLGLGLALGPGAGGTHPHGVHVSLDGFTVNTTADGIVDVTVTDLRNPALMRQVLAQAGVPAIVWISNPPSCYRAPVPTGNAIQLTRGRTGTMFTINPAAIPAGTEVDMGFGAAGSPGFPVPPRPRSDGLPREVIFGLVKEGCQPAPSGTG